MLPEQGIRMFLEIFAPPEWPIYAVLKALPLLSSASRNSTLSASSRLEAPLREPTLGSPMDAGNEYFHFAW